MKEKIHYVIEAVLAVAVIILFVFQFSGDKKPATANVSESEISFGDVMPVAYIDIDSLMSNYTFSIDLNELLMKKYENSQAVLTERARKLQADAENFQRKLQTGSFLSEERAIQDRDRLMKAEEDYRAYEQKLALEFEEERLNVNEELRKAVISILSEFNKENKYHIIYGRKNDNILYANDSYNVTAEAIKFFNMKYMASPSGEK